MAKTVGNPVTTSPVFVAFLAENLETAEDNLKAVTDAYGYIHLYQDMKTLDTDTNLDDGDIVGTFVLQSLYRVKKNNIKLEAIDE